MLPVLAGTDAKGKHLNKRNERRKDSRTERALASGLERKQERKARER